MVNLKDIKKKAEKASPLNKEKSGLMDFLNKDYKIGGAAFNNKRKEHFYSELYILLTAGVNIKSALELVVEQEGNKEIKAIISQIKADVIKGKSLSLALDATGHFSLYETYSIRIGEESGKLPEILKELGFYYAKKIKLNRQIVSAMSYPITVIVVAITTIMFLLNFVVPMFSDVFGRFNKDLPFLTKVVIRISSYSGYFFAVLGLMVLLSLVLYYTQRQKRWFRKLLDETIVKLPLVGHLVKKIFLARFCVSMNLLLNAKTPLIISMQLVQKMISFYPIEYSLINAEKNIMKGKFLYESLEEYPIYDRRMVSLIKVAEEVNQLEVIFAKLAQQYSDEVDHQTGLLSSLIEPVMIIFLGIVVSVILIAMYMPLFQLSSSFN